MRGHNRPSQGLRPPCGVSSLILSVIATAAGTQPNTTILSVVIALGPSGPVFDEQSARRIGRAQ